MDLTELVKATEQWFIDRNLHNSDPSKQMLKLYEEYGELAGGYLDENESVILDSVGDMMVVMTGLSLQKGVRNPIDNSEVEKHDNEKLLFIQLSEFIGMLSSSIAKNKDVKYVEEFLMMINHTLKQLSDSLGVNYTEALSMAYNEIKDRKGKLIDGVFVKEEDLNEG